MKTLIIGFIVFLGWTCMSSYIYICKIKGLCSEQEAILLSTMKVNDVYTADSLPDTLAASPSAPNQLLHYFAYDKSEFITDSAVSKFCDASIAYMLHNPDAGLQIIGHTDAKGSDEYNQALGFRRAQSVLDYFEGKGMPVEKLKAGSKGEKEPAENNSTDEGRAKNRRVTVTIKN